MIADIKSKMPLVILLVSLLILAAPSQKANAYTLDDAYKKALQKRIAYSPRLSEIGDYDSSYLEHIFYVTDLTTRINMLMLEQLEGGKEAMPIEKYNAEISFILKGLIIVEPPEKLEGIDSLLEDAIEEQRKFFNMWASAKGEEKSYYGHSYKKHPYLVNSHEKIIEAYSLLMRTFPNESRYNKQAIKSHLLALDIL
jgi:hypothetical protein